MRAFLESVRIALGALWVNKLRSVLTLIGVIIGVTTIIAIVSMINGMNAYVANQISGLGATTFIIDQYGMVTSEEQWWNVFKRKKITIDDMKAVADNCPDCAEVGGRMFTTRTIKRGSQYLDDVYIVGATANFVDIVKQEIERGHFLTDDDYLHRRNVAFIGYDVVDNLFPGLDPVGKEIKIDGRQYTIIGHGTREGSTLGQSNDNYVFIPLTTFEKQFGSRRSLDLFVKAASFEIMDETQDQVRLVLRARRGVKYHEEDNFGIMTAADFMSMWETFSSGAAMVMVGISSISLVVGGIVIMNIMLVSVTERTREVGIRKAVGARRKNIMFQFLAEAVTLSLVGGGIGVALGFIIGIILTAQIGVPAGVALWSVFLGLGVSTVVGTFFGVYPAVKAARLDPIEALRRE
jgi:putative ABC transport system permease protein